MDYQFITGGFTVVTALVVTGSVALFRRGIHFANAGLLYPFKWSAEFIHMWLYLKRQPQKITRHDPYAPTDDLVLSGVVPSTTEIKLETDRNLPDTLVFTGFDVPSNGYFLYVRMTRKGMSAKCPDEGFVCLGTKDGAVYEMVRMEDGGLGASGFGAPVLELLEPMERWRVSFNGLLRKKKYNDSKLVHVKFSFIWSSFTEPFDYDRDCSAELLADFAATQREWLPEMDHKFRTNAYGQYGQFQGTISLYDGEETVVRLRGQRLHATTGCDDGGFGYRMDISSYTEDGNGIHVGFLESQQSESRLQYGCVYEPTGHNQPVTWSTLPQRVVDTNDVTKRNSSNFSFKMSAGKKTYEISAECCSGPSFTFQDGGRTSMVRLAELDVGGRKGSAYVTQSWKKDGTEMKCSSKKSTNIHDASITDEPIEYSNKKNWVVSLTQKNGSSTNIRLVGGKGASLALLSQLTNNQENFSVPEAICVTSASYFHHVREVTEVSTEIRNLEDVAWKRRRKLEGGLKESCEKAVEAMTSSKLTAAVRLVLWEVFRGHFGVGDKKFAVRSSAIGEDGTDMSAAGQNETFLGVRTFEEICDAVVKCWASQFAFPAVEYKRQHGQLLNPGMAVVIQEMVEPEVAGVMFTVDPASDNPATIVITANYGLAESVVSASAEPDTISLDRVSQNKDGGLSVKERKLGAKRIKTVMNRDGGVSEIESSEFDMSKICLTDTMAVNIGKVGIRIEESYGFQVDIEWAVRNDKIYLLQARPVTSSNQMTDFEFIHELDSGIRTDRDRSTKANTGEVFPNATTHLTLTTMVKFINLACLKNVHQRNSSILFSGRNLGRQMVVTQNHLMMNCLDFCFRETKGKQSLTNKVMELSIFGHVLDDHEMYQLSGERYSNSATSSVTYLFNLVKDLMTSKQRINKMAASFESFKDGIKQSSNLLDVYESITNCFPTMVEICTMHTLTSVASAFWNIVAIQTLTEGKMDWSDTLYADIAHLLSSCSGVESADVPAAIRNLATIIREDPSVDKFTEETQSEESIRWIREESSSHVREAFEQFLMNHGHRCLKEFDLRSKPWKTDPSSLVQVLRNMVRHPESMNSTKTVLTAEQTMDKLKTKIKSRTKWILGWILPRYRAAVGYREQSKSILIKSTDVLRQGYLSLAESMLHRGFLPEVDLIFFLTHSEIGQLLSTRSSRLVTKAFRRRRLQGQLEKLRFSEISIGFPKPIEETVSAWTGTGVKKVTGTPVCNGTAIGTARVVRTLEEANEIQIGDILVTYSTDIGWSPYFPLLSGVVTEIGGILSHGAVVAREYGLPCIVGAENATTMFNSGEQVMLNGTKGILEMH